MLPEDQHPQLLHDIDKALAGILALGQYFTMPDDLPASISIFSSESGVVRAGEPAEYEIKLVNNRRQHCWLNLLVDIYLKDHPIHPEGHHAYFAKNVFVPGKAVQRVTFIYDWQKTAAFTIDGVPLPADDAWFGPCDARKAYMIRALLRSMEGNLLEELILVQRLVS